jgi:glutamate racemase
MMKRQARPIGIFDSGIGGLTVLKEIARVLPGEHLIYLGDTARLPYGNKSPATITRYALEATHFLLDKHIKLLVVACNTASAVSLKTLEDRFRIPVVGVIQPGARRAVEATRTGRIGVIGTEGTVKSEAYPRAIRQISPRVRVFPQPCPLFVPIVEEGLSENGIAQATADFYLRGMKKYGIDILVLGCTHYPLLKRVIRKTIGPQVALVDSARETAREVLQVLTKNHLQNSRRPKGGRRLFYVTDYPERFQKVGEKFLGAKLGKVIEVKI